MATINSIALVDKLDSVYDERKAALFKELVSAMHDNANQHYDSNDPVIVDTDSIFYALKRKRTVGSKFIEHTLEEVEVEDAVKIMFSSYD